MYQSWSKSKGAKDREKANRGKGERESIGDSSCGTFWMMFGTMGTAASEEGILWADWHSCRPRLPVSDVSQHNNVAIATAMTSELWTGQTQPVASLSLHSQPTMAHICLRKSETTRHLHRAAVFCFVFLFLSIAQTKVMCVQRAQGGEGPPTHRDCNRAKNILNRDL